MCSVAIGESFGGISAVFMHSVSGVLVPYVLVVSNVNHDSEEPVYIVSIGQGRWNEQSRQQPARVGRRYLLELAQICL